MLIGKCAECGETYAGWLLSKPKYCKCPRCGGNLVIRDDNDDSIEDDQQHQESDD